MAEESFEAVRFEVAKLDCGPDDTIVIKLPEGLPNPLLDSFANYLKRSFPDMKFMLLMAGMDISVLGPERVDRPQTRQ